MHARNDLPTGYLPKVGEAAGDEIAAHDFQLAGLALATLVLLVAHAGVTCLPYTHCVTGRRKKKCGRTSMSPWVKCSARAFGHQSCPLSLV